MRQTHTQVLLAVILVLLSSMVCADEQQDTPREANARKILGKINGLNKTIDQLRQELAENQGKAKEYARLKQQLEQTSRTATQYQLELNRINRQLRKAASDKTKVEIEKETVQNKLMLAQAEISELNGKEKFSNAYNILEKFTRNSDRDWRVYMEPFVSEVDRASAKVDFNWSIPMARIKIGGVEKLQVSIMSARTGFIYLVYASRDSNQFALLYPNDGKDIYLQNTNTPLIIPRRWPAEGNDGKPEQDTIAVIISEHPIPELFKYTQGGFVPATTKLVKQFEQAITPCKSLGGGEDTCRASGEKSLGVGENTNTNTNVTTYSRRFGVARVLLSEYLN